MVPSDIAGFSCLYCCGCFSMNNYITWRVKRSTWTQAVIIWRLARWQRDTPWPHRTHNDRSRRSETGQSRRCRCLPSCVCVCGNSLSRLCPVPLLNESLHPDSHLVSRPVTPNASIYRIITTHTHTPAITVSVSAVMLPFQSECSQAKINCIHNPFYLVMWHISESWQDVVFIHHNWDLLF